MLLRMQTILETCLAWAEGCGCHSYVSQDGQHTSPHTRVRQFRELLGGSQHQCMYETCPMRGRRAPELACGDLAAMFAELCSTQGSFLECWMPDLGPKDRQTIIEDFAGGMERIRLLLSMKLLSWEELPWKLAGCAHADMDKARACAMECMSLFDMDPLSVGAQHRVSQEFLADASPSSLRMSLQAFARGGALREHPELLQRLLELRCIPVCERFVERQHSLVKSSLAGKHRKHPTQVSLSNRMLEFERRCAWQPEDDRGHPARGHLSPVSFCHQRVLFQANFPMHSAAIQGQVRPTLIYRPHLPLQMIIPSL